MRFENLPASTVRVFGDDVGSVFSARLTSTGALQLWTSAQQGSDSAELIVAGDGKWHRIEISLVKNASAQITDITLRLNDATVATVSGLTSTFPASIKMGWIDSPGSSAVCYVDDYAVNDSSGANQNSWVGDSKLVLAVPISDNARTTGWVTGAGGTTSLFDAVNNIPPVGVADTGTATSQIRDATSEASASYDANLTTYTSLGIDAAATINVVVPVVATGAPVTTSSKQGLIGMASNPAITTVALGATGTAGAFWQGNAAATYPTGWKWSLGTTTYVPSVTKGNSPVARITQVTSSTRIADVCFLGMYVDYTPSAVVIAPIPNVVMAPQRA